MDKDAFSECLYIWSRELLIFLEKDHTPDQLGWLGTARYSQGRREKTVESASSDWVTEQQFVLGQETVAAKSNEKTCSPEQIKSLDLEGALVSCDAAGWRANNGARKFLIAIKDQINDYEQLS